MTELDNALLQRLEARLHERQEILWDDIGVVLKDAGHENLTELSGQVHDSGEESVADMLADLDIARISGEVAELKDIELALLRMKNATYGQCTDCGEAINVERLEAFPAVRRCVSCQASYEDKHSERDQTPSI